MIYAFTGYIYKRYSVDGYLDLQTSAPLWNHLWTELFATELAQLIKSKRSSVVRRAFDCLLAVLKPYDESVSSAWLAERLICRSLLDGSLNTSSLPMLEHIAAISRIEEERSIRPEEIPGWSTQWIAASLDLLLPTVTLYLDASSENDELQVR